MLKRTSRRRPILLPTIILLTICLLAGCPEDERVVEVAREAANRQAEQNRQIALQNQQIAQTAKHLVEADGQPDAQSNDGASDCQQSKWNSNPMSHTRTR